MKPACNRRAAEFAFLLIGLTTAATSAAEWDPYVAEFYARRVPKNAADSPPPATQFMYGETIQLVCRFGYKVVGAQDTYKAWELKIGEDDNPAAWTPIAEFPQSELPPGEPMTMVAKTYFAFKRGDPQAPPHKHWFSCTTLTSGILEEPAGWKGNNKRTISVTISPVPVAVRTTGAAQSASEAAVVPPAARNPVAASQSADGSVHLLGDRPDLKLVPELQVGPVKTSWGSSISLAAEQATSRAAGKCTFPFALSVANAGPVVARGDGTGAFFVAITNTITSTGASVGTHVFQLDPLGAGATETLSGSIGLNAGAQVLRARADSVPSVAESDERNNGGQLAITVNGKCDQDYAVAQPEASGPTLATTAVPGILNIEGESLVDGMKYQLPGDSFAGRVKVHSALNAGLSGGQTLVWEDAVPGAVLDLALDIPAAGKYAVEIYFWRGPSSGTIDIEVAGKKALQGLALVSPPNVPVGPTQAGTISLAQGPANLSILLLAKPQTSGWNPVVAVDRVRLYWAGPP